MSLKITHKNSTTAGTPPSAGDIDVGEIAINAADAELYTKDTAGNIRKFQNTTTGTAAGVQFTQAGSGAVQRTVESKLQDVVSVKDFGAVGDGVADDTAAIQAAVDTGKTVYFPDGVYLLEAALTINTPVEMASGAIIDNETNAISVYITGSFVADRSKKFLRATVRFSNQPVIYPEWIGVQTSETSANNRLHWDRFIRYNYDASRGNGNVELGSGSYPFDAPFYVPGELRLFGQGLRHTEIKLAGVDQHGVEFCEISGSNVLRTEASLTSSVAYVTLSGVHFNSSDQTFTGGTKKAVCYAVTASSSFIEKCRFNSPSSETNQMDGILLVPANLNPGSIASQRTRVIYNRITNVRDAIVVGRHEAGSSVSEPTFGGSGSAVGGNSYEHEIHGNMIFSVQPGGSTFKTLLRRGIVVQYHATANQEKPYNIEISRNTVICGYSDDTSPGTYGVTNASTAATYSGDLTTILPTIDANNLRVLSLKVNQGTGAVYNQPFSSFVAGGLTLTNAWKGSTDGTASASIHSGVGIDIQTKGMGVNIYNNFIDYGVYGIRLGANSQGCNVWGNQTQGTQSESIRDTSADKSGHWTAHKHTAGGPTAYGPQAKYNGDLRTSILQLGSNETAAGSLVIDSGVITVTESYHRVDTEASDASDDLDTINGGKNGQLLIIHAANSARDVVVKNNTGNIYCGADLTLNHGRDSLMLVYDANIDKWIRLSWADNAT